MTETVPEDWDDVVRTLRRDLETVSEGDGADEDVGSAIDEVWAIVDALEERVGPLDVEEIADVLGVDDDAGPDAIDVESIPRELVTVDPERAARLGRLVDLVNLDDATSYDVGRLWSDDGGEGGSDGADEGEANAEDAPVESSTDDAASEATTGDADEDLRAQLGDALSQFRDQIGEARERIGPTEDHGDEGESAERDEAEDPERESDGPTSTTTRRSSRSSRRSTALSTMPSARPDVGSGTRLSTVPGRRGGSSPSFSSDSEDDRPETDGDE